MNLRGFAQGDKRFNILTTPAVKIVVCRVFGPYYRIYAVDADGNEERAGWALGYRSAELFGLLLALAREGVMARGKSA